MALKEILKQCPYCGSTDVHISGHGRVLFKTGLERAAFVECGNCMSRSPCIRISMYGNTSHSAKAKQHAVYLWNQFSDIVSERLGEN